MRRAFDIVFSLMILLMALPLCLVIAVAVKLSSPGPILFVQERVGKGEEVFRMFKFRSMRVADMSDGLQLTADGDSRITSVGKVIRPLKLDELPQFLNVLAGSMAIVGPRPEVPRYVSKYDSRMREVFRYKPGLTDPASIRFRREPEILAASSDPERTYVTEILPEKLKMSVEYQRNRTFLTDLRVIGRTVLLILRR